MLLPVGDISLVLVGQAGLSCAQPTPDLQWELQPGPHVQAVLLM